MVFNDVFVELTYGKTIGCTVYLNYIIIGDPYIICFYLSFAADRISISVLVYEWLHFQNINLSLFLELKIKIEQMACSFHKLRQGISEVPRLFLCNIGYLNWTFK